LEANLNDLHNSYSSFYETLSAIREKLHSSGSFDDSNAKLDEMIKFISMAFCAQKGWIEEQSIQNILETDPNDKAFMPQLRKLFDECVNMDVFKNSDGSSIFGVAPSLSIKDSDAEFGHFLLSSIDRALSDLIRHNSNGHPFDIVNEVFGHFIRDNFRNNKEDAQYMTPPEVVDFMCHWAIQELTIDQPDFLSQKFTVMDPCCGVGSFLTSFYRATIEVSESARDNLVLIGQDKVDRMVRLSKINMILFDTQNHFIDSGNSIVGKSGLDKFHENVDLILTNPPFNAKFLGKEISDEPNYRFPLLHDIARSTTTTIDSELLIIDRALSQLRESGHLFIIVPDSVISAHGLPDQLRSRIQQVATLRGMVELPTVTFAQAGTRTRTCILHLQKHTKTHKRKIFIGIANDLGFEVSIRGGVPIKKHTGRNDLHAIETVLRDEKMLEKSSRTVVSEEPSCVFVPYSDVIEHSWTPNHYSSRRYKAIDNLQMREDIKVTALGQLVNFSTKDRRSLKPGANSKCLSVLHVIGDGFINFDELLIYQPKTKGNVCYPGDILISKINPRIPRILVVPDEPQPLTCSNEFEIMKPKAGVDPFFIAYSLQLQVVHHQIISLTSGTSSSHNRVKTNDLKRVKIPVPIPGTSQASEMETVIKQYKTSIQSLLKNAYAIHNLKARNNL
jgi:type I restriction-modification system DNA methylase subunit